MRNSIEQLINRYLTDPNKTQEEMEKQRLSPSERGLDIMARVLTGKPIVRREVLNVLRMLPDDHDGETLKESLRNLEQDILRNRYQQEIVDINDKLARSKVIPYREIVSKKASDKSQSEIWITQSHQERMKKKLEGLDLLLKSNPLMDSRQRRRKREKEMGRRK